MLSLVSAACLVLPAPRPLPATGGDAGNNDTPHPEARLVTPVDNAAVVSPIVAAACLGPEATPPAVLVPRQATDYVGALGTTPS